MKRKLTSLIVVFVALCTSCFPVSDELGGGSNNEVDETLKPFIGYWDYHRDSYHYYEWLFAADGTCKFYVDFKLEHEGNWTFNSATSILATTASSYSWQVIITADNAWAGIRLGADMTSESFTRLEDSEVAKYELAGSWKDSDGGTKTFGTYQYRSIGDGKQSGNVYGTQDNWKLLYNYWSIVNYGDDYDGVCKVMDEYTYVDGKGDSRDTYIMTMTLDEEYRMNAFELTREGGGRVITYTRVEPQE